MRKFAVALAASLLLSVSFGASAYAVDAAQMRAEMLAPTYRVVHGNVNGSGTAIFSAERDGEIQTFVLTNEHVVDVTPEGAEGVKVANDVSVEKVIYNKAGKEISTISHPAKVVAYSKVADLAVLLLADDTNTVPTAKLADADVNVGVFDHVFAIGSGLGNPPFPTDGIIGNTDIDNDGWPHWQYSASTIFGNSGGGLYAEVNGHFELIGVPTLVQGYGKDERIVDPNVALAIKISTVREFLRRVHLGFIIGEEAGEGINIPPSLLLPPGNN